MRQYPDAAGQAPLSASLEDHLDITASRIRLNAGALDWRSPPAPGEGSDAASAVQVIGESPDGVQDGKNLRFATAYPYVPQTLKLWLNGQRSRLGEDSDYTVSESGGAGSGFDSILLDWALLPQDHILVDYTKA